MIEDVNKKPKLEVVAEELDADEKDFRALRRDLPGVKGASAVGIVNINVSKSPGKNEFFRTHPEFRAVFPVIDLEVGMEKQFFVATEDMVASLAAIGITVADYTLYLTVNASGAVHLVPVRCCEGDGAQNEYSRTKRKAFSTASKSGCGSTPIRRTIATRSIRHRKGVTLIRSGRS